MSRVFDAIVLCAGRGERFDPLQVKLFAMIEGKPALLYLLQRLEDSPLIRSCVCVLRDEHRAGVEALAQALGARLLYASGGERRQDSLRKGLETLQQQSREPPTPWIMVFDAARPLVSESLLQRIAERVAEIEAQPQTAEPLFAVTPLLPLFDTIKRVDAAGDILETLPREDLRASQTPQCFRREPLLDLLSLEQTQDCTDEAELFERHGHKVAHVAGEVRAHKITTRQDAALLAGFVRPQPPREESRTCTGFDIHKRCEGTAIRLCGVEIPCDFALLGHSDADVALHALTDALFALSGAGDIGEHFPPEDSRWRGADSRLFLQCALEKLTAAGGRLCHADITLLAEAPDLRPHRARMRAALASVTGLSSARIGLKATTLEGLGALGRGEGIAALASASANFPSCLVEENRA